MTYIEGRFKSGSAVGKEITVPEGASVGVQVVLDATGNTSGGLKVEVWKRIALSPDIPVQTCDGAAALVKGAQAVYSCDFVPDDLTSRRFTHYYLKAYWDGAPLTVEPRAGEGVKTVPGPTTPATARTPTPTPSPSKEWNLEGIRVDSSTVTVLLRVYAGIDLQVTLDGAPADEVRPVLPILEYVFVNVTAGQHTVEVQDVVGHEVKAEIVVDTPNATPDEDPEWVGQLIRKLENEPVANPPLSITRYGYRGQTVYFVPQRCCDIFSDLYDSDGEIIGHPDGGITGRGDGSVPDFSEERSNGRMVWEDQRTQGSGLAQGQVPITLGELLAGPDRYNGREILLEGFYFHGWESNLLGERMEASGFAEGHLWPQGQKIWVAGSMPTEVYDRLHQQEMMGPSERYGKVRIKGTFQYGDRYGHLGGFDAQIVVSEAEVLPWSPPTEVQ